jgi:purine-nucleoside phosphorylase
MNAAYLGKRALAICTVSDHLLTGEALDADARQTSFTDMMEIALNVAALMG